MTREMKNSGIEWIGQIPADWEIHRLKTCFTEHTGGAWGDEPQGNENDCICIRVADFDYDRMTVKKSGDYEYTKRNYTDDTILKLKLDKNDILIEKSGGGEKTPVGRTIIFKEDFKALYANFIERLKTSEFALPEFMQYLLVAFYKNKYTTKYIKQTTGIQNLDISSMLANEKIVLPPLSEQKRIADFLDSKVSEIDKMIAETKSSIENYKEYKQSVITEAVTKGLNKNVQMKDSGIDWIGQVPADWEVVKIKYVSKVSRGLFNHRPRNDERYYNGAYPFIQTGDVASADKYITKYSQTLNELGKSVSKEFPKGTLTMTIAANIGDVSILGFDSYFPDSIIGFIPNENIQNIYLYYIFKAMKEQFINASVMNTQLNLNIERVREIFVPITYNQDNQQEIIDYLDSKCAEIDNLISEKEALVSNLEEYKKSLIYEYVTGKKLVL